MLLCCIICQGCFRYLLKAVKVMHAVAVRNESSVPRSDAHPNLLSSHKRHMGEMFAFHATTMSNTLNNPFIVFTRTGSMANLLSHYRPYSTIFAFTNERVLTACSWCLVSTFNFTIRRGVSTQDTVSVNYDDFVNDVEVGDELLVDGGMMSLAVKVKDKGLG